MLIKTKKHLTFVCIGINYLLTGIQYAIIFPSLNNFITARYGASTTIFGVIIASYSVSGFFSGPLLGYIVDKKKNSRTVVNIGNIANIIGNIMYMMGISPTFLIISRLVCGIGSGSASAMFADISRSTTVEERTGIISILMVLQEFGLLFAPVFAIMLRKVHFYIGPFLIDKYTAPGLVMAVLYTILQICFIFMYFNLINLNETKKLEDSMHYDEKDERSSDASSTKSEGGIDHSANSYEPNDSLNNLYYAKSQSGKNSISEEDQIHVEENIRHKNEQKYEESPNPTQDPYLSSMSSEMIESAERYILSLSDSDSVVSGCSNRAHSPDFGASSKPSNANSSVPRSQNMSSELPHVSVQNEHEPKINHKNQFVRDEIVTLFGLQFISAFSQTTLETIVTPLSKKLFMWTDLENSYFFLVAGVVILGVFIVLRFVSRCVSDRNLIVFGLISMIASYVSAIAFFVPAAIPDSMASFPFLVIVSLFDFFGLPILMVCSPSLVSKLISSESQGFAQGLRRSCLFIGLIMGPLWGGSTVNMLNVMFGVPLAFLLVISILFLLSYKKMKLRNERSYSVLSAGPMTS